MTALEMNIHTLDMEDTERWWTEAVKLIYVWSWELKSWELRVQMHAVVHSTMKAMQHPGNSNTEQFCASRFSNFLHYGNLHCLNSRITKSNHKKCVHNKSPLYHNVLVCLVFLSISKHWEISSEGVIGRDFCLGLDPCHNGKATTYLSLTNEAINYSHCASWFWLILIILSLHVNTRKRMLVQYFTIVWFKTVWE